MNIFKKVFSPLSLKIEKRVVVLDVIPEKVLAPLRLLPGVVAGLIIWYCFAFFRESMNTIWFWIIRLFASGAMIFYFGPLLAAWLVKVEIMRIETRKNVLLQNRAALDYICKTKAYKNSNDKERSKILSQFIGEVLLCGPDAGRRYIAKLGDQNCERNPTQGETSEQDDDIPPVI
jgi:hypothetical protein